MKYRIHPLVKIYGASAVLTLSVGLSIGSMLGAIYLKAEVAHLKKKLAELPPTDLTSTNRASFSRDPETGNVWIYVKPPHNGRIAMATADHPWTPGEHKPGIVNYYLFFVGGVMSLEPPAGVRIEGVKGE